MGLSKQEQDDLYYFDICESVAKNSKCLSRHIGAVLTRDNIVVSTGYNGPPRGVPHCDKRDLYDNEYRDWLIQEAKNNPKFDPTRAQKECPRKVMGFKSGEGLSLCPAVHSEKNCIVSAARNGASTKGTALYLNAPVPCSQCLVALINAGVEEVVCTGMDYYDSLSQFLVLYSGIKIRTFCHISNNTYKESNGLRLVVKNKK